MLDPEQAYQNFVAHCSHCNVCQKADGEWADPEDLCPTGQTLAALWARAEIAAAAEVN